MTTTEDKATWQYVNTPRGRATFPSLFKMNTMIKNGREIGEAKYRIGILIPKKLAADQQAYWDDMKILALRVAVEQFGKNLPSDISWPWIDGDIPTGKRTEPAPGYAGHWLIRAVSGKRPTVVDVYGEAIVDESLIFGGMNIALNINFFGYDYGDPGVSMGFSHVIALGGGTPFEGDNRPVEEVFSTYIQKPGDKDSDDPTEF